MTAPLPQLLLVEDDPAMGAALVTGLGRAGWKVHWHSDGIEAYAALQTLKLDALVLDLGLPGMGGLDLLHRLRQTDTRLPVIVVTAYGELSDRIRGLDFGADDYLVKPFELDELCARLRALTRRARDSAKALVTVREVEVDLNAHTVRVAGEPVWLTGREFSVLQLLLQHLGQPVSREAIQRHLYAWGDTVEPNTVDVFVHTLRRKVGRDFIHTFRGSGYIISR